MSSTGDVMYMVVVIVGYSWFLNVFDVPMVVVIVGIPITLGKL